MRMITTTHRTTTAEVIRDFLKAGGRILVTPEGELTEGAGLPWSSTHGTHEEAAECVRAGRTYFAARSQPGANDQIERAARMLGRPTANGWLVLEARSTAKDSLH